MTDFAAARRAMVDCQVRPADVTRFGVISAMLAVPRERFVPRAQRDVAYADAPIPITEGRFLLEPRVFAKMLDAAAIGPDDLVLDVGCGTGYSAVVASRMAGAVVAIEQDEAMAAQAAENARSLGADTVIVETRALGEGAPDSGPYDVILVEGAVASVPDALISQLKDGGRLIAIVQNGAVGQARRFVRTGAHASSRRLFDAFSAVLPGFDVAPAFEF